MDAKEQGLVDVEGGFFDAVERARAEAGLDPSAPWSLVTFDPWIGDPENIPARLVRTLAPQPVAEVPEELDHAMALWRLRDEKIFTILPWRMELE